MPPENGENEAALKNPARRSFLEKALSWCTAGAVVTAYGIFATYAVRFLFPARERQKAWLYVAELARLKPGDSVRYTSPLGEKIAVARQGPSDSIEDFVALSSTCPHLGCQVHWEGNKNRFFCPCHNGTFDPKGVATGGPPADAGQRLPEYPLRIDHGLLYIEVPMEGISGGGRLMKVPGARKGAH